MVTFDMVLFLSRIPLTQIHRLEFGELIGTIIEHSSAAVNAYGRKKPSAVPQ